MPGEKETESRAKKALVGRGNSEAAVGKARHFTALEKPGAS
jgi:hypothetical protein